MTPHPHPLFDHENFDFKPLRQLIISYAIRDNKGQVSPEEVRNCRLVNSDWLQIITQTLLQAKEPLFHLKLDQDHCFKGSGYFGKNDKKLLELDQASPLALTIEESYFRSANSMERIGQHLSRFQDNLVSLKVALKPNVSSLLFSENLTMPVLQYFSVEFTEDTSEPASLSLQTVLDSCPELKMLGFSSRSDEIYANVVLPEDFTRVILPETLTAIEFSTKLENQHLEIMTRTFLPNLKKFTLLILRATFEDGLLTRVLDSVKNSLEQLSIEGEDHDGSPYPPTYFRFPVMHKLKQLELESQHLELNPEVKSLETYLPNLTEMRLMYQTQSMLRKWTTSQSRFATVTMLYVTMTNDNFRDTDPEYFVNLNETVVREIAHIFPNLKDFMIDFSHGHIQDYQALKVVFEDMTQLETLTLFVPSPTDNIYQDIWTAILLGGTYQTVTCPWTKRLDICWNNPSIQQMKNLKTLEIWETCSETSEENKNSDPKFQLLSDSVFELAFLTMPQLKGIFLEETSWVSQEMIQKWEASSSERKICFFK